MVLRTPLQKEPPCALLVGMEIHAAFVEKGQAVPQEDKN